MTRSVEIPDAALKAAFDAYTSDFSISIEDAVRAALVAARPYLMPEVVVDVMQDRIATALAGVGITYVPQQEQDPIYDRLAAAVLALLSTSGEDGNEQ